MSKTTPRTDDIAHFGFDSETYICRMTDLARKFEQELAELQQRLIDRTAVYEKRDAAQVKEITKLENKLLKAREESHKIKTESSKRMRECQLKLAKSQVVQRKMMGELRGMMEHYNPDATWIQDLISESQQLIEETP